ncbi:MAG: hypothetical protein DRG50_03310 [Deltaproteobacteria bacterium]|nr:MAG: hypothetical protein DRG50_03310 [Deltaproteobacteria bacterium]
MRYVGKTGITKILFLLFFIFLIAFATFILPHIDMKWLRNRIAEEASSRLKGKVLISHAYLSLLPQPHIQLKGIRIKSTHWGEFISEDVGILLHLKPLLKREVALKRLSLKGPVFNLILTKGAIAKGEEGISYLRKIMEHKIPILELEGGRINVLRPGERKPSFKIKALEGSIVPKGEEKIELRLRFSSNVASRMELIARGDPALGRGWFELSAKGISLGKLIPLIGWKGIYATASRMDLHVRGEAKRWDKIKLRLEGGDFRITFVCKGREQQIRGRSWEGVLEREENLWSGSIDSLELLTPSLRLSAWAKGKRGEYFSFLIKGKGVSVEEIRKMALKLMGEDETVKEIFHILQAGEVSQIVCSGEGKDFREALDMEHNVRIRGTLSGGKILVPAGPLPLEEVSGEAEISQAVMRAWDIEARLGRSLAKRGMLTIGLIADRDIFHLEAEIEADAEDVVRYLPMVLQGSGMEKEIKRFQEVKGWGKGRLVLGEDIHDIRPKVEVEDLQVSFRHELSPWPISLEEGKLSFLEGVLSWKEVKGRWGKSALAHGAGRICFAGDRPSLEISHLEGNVILEEMGNWLMSSLGLEGLKSLGGELELKDMRLKATFNPLQAEDVSFHAWTDDLFIHPSFSSNALLLKRGEIRCDNGLGLKTSGDDRIRTFGKVAWKADNILWRDYNWKNTEGIIAFKDHGVEITVARATLCGINFQGNVSPHGDLTTLEFQLWAKGADLPQTISCLGGKALIEGKFRLEANIKATGKKDPFYQTSQGTLVFYSKKGRIYRWTLLSRLFSLLNIIEYFKGKFPDITKKGFPYDKFTIKGELKNGLLQLKEAVIDGPAMKIVGEGKIDLLKGEANLVVLMAPLKTVDVVINHIPVLGKVLTGKSGTFISVPFSIKGSLYNPKITPLPPSAVGASLWGLLKRTLQAPMEMIKPVLPKK